MKLIVFKTLTILLQLEMFLTFVKGLNVNIWKSAHSCDIWQCHIETTKERQTYGLLLEPGMH